MKKFEVFPISPNEVIGEINEVFQHRCFLEATDEDRRRIMFESSLSKYNNELEKPWDRYFDTDLAPMLAGKEILDLGCFTGGRTMAWMEKYEPKKMFGTDIAAVYIEAAMRFACYKKADANFIVSKGENLPFMDRSLDAILSYDVFEHVQNLELTLNECHRVLRFGGRLMLVFPSYFHPLEHHLDFVTKVPAIHYIFSGATLVRAYSEICAERGSESYWYRRNSDSIEEWEKGNTLNGITLRKFQKLIANNGWTVVSHRRQPLGALIPESAKKPSVRLISIIGRSCMHFPILAEGAINRVVYILEKSARE